VYKRQPSRGHRIPHRVHDWRCRMKVRLAQFEMDDRAALPLEFFRARKYFQRSFAIQLSNA